MASCAHAKLPASLQTPHATLRSTSSSTHRPEAVHRSFGPPQKEEAETGLWRYVHPGSQTEPLQDARVRKKLVAVTEDRREPGPRHRLPQEALAESRQPPGVHAVPAEKDSRVTPEDVILLARPPAAQVRKTFRRRHFLACTPAPAPCGAWDSSSMGFLYHDSGENKRLCKSRVSAAGERSTTTLVPLVVLAVGVAATKRSRVMAPASSTRGRNPAGESSLHIFT